MRSKRVGHRAVQPAANESAFYCDICKVSCVTSAVSISFFLCVCVFLFPFFFKFFLGTCNFTITYQIVFSVTEIMSLIQYSKFYNFIFRALHFFIVRLNCMAVKLCMSYFHYLRKDYTVGGFIIELFSSGVETVVENYDLSL